MADMPQRTAADLIAQYYQGSTKLHSLLEDSVTDEFAMEPSPTGMVPNDCDEPTELDDYPVPDVNPSVKRCSYIWRKVILDELMKSRERENPDPLAVRTASAYERGTYAYCSAMPHLTSRQAISDYIACVAHGIAIGAIPASRGSQLLYGAQVASSTLPKRRRS